MKNMPGYFPKSLSEALLILKDAKEKGLKLKIAAGCTDILPRAESFPDIFADGIIDITDIEELKSIGIKDGKLVIGSCVTHTQLAESPIIREKAGALASAASEIGSPQIRNRGTIGGNICNASPVGDTLPSMYVLNAVMRIVSADENGCIMERMVPVKDFIKGPGRTDIGPYEILAGIYAEIPSENEIFRYIRSSARKALAISKSSVAFRGIKENGRFRSVRIALGCVGPVIEEGIACKELIESGEVSDSMADRLEEAVAKDCSPIDDLRSTKEYRSYIVSVFLKKIIMGQE